MENKNLIIFSLIAIVLILVGIIGVMYLTNNSDINGNNSTNETINVTENNTTNETNETTTKKSSTKNTKSSSNSGYKYSQQYDDYVKEYTDSEGNQHIDTKSGDKQSYNPKTGVMTTKTKDGKVYHDQMN